MTPAASDPPPREPHPREPHPQGSAPPAEAADAAWVARLDDSLRSLKTLTAIVGLLAAAALGVALWALLAGDGEDDRGASPARVARIEDRVDQLENDVDQLAEQQQDVAQLTDQVDRKADQSEVQQLADQVDQLAQQAGDDGAAEQNAQAIADLQEQVEVLTRELEAMSSGGP